MASIIVAKKRLIGQSKTHELIHKIVPQSWPNRMKNIHVVISSAHNSWTKKNKQGKVEHLNLYIK